MNTITPETNQLKPQTVSIFLAGSIETGKAEDWQSKVIESLKEFENLTIYNPRRNDWDSSWKQEESSSQFNHQVNWELNHLENSDLIFMNFCEGTYSPISLLELGLFANHRKMVVVCPREFWRRGNVQIVCTRFGIPLYETLDEGIGGFVTKIYELSPIH